MPKTTPSISTNEEAVAETPTGKEAAPELPAVGVEPSARGPFELAEVHASPLGDVVFGTYTVDGLPYFDVYIHADGKVLSNSTIDIAQARRVRDFLTEYIDGARGPKWLEFKLDEDG